MTAFLFIPAIRDARQTRRVDFANIASLFSDAEEPTARRSPLRGNAMRFATAALILVGIVGDTMLVARPKLLADVFATARTNVNAARGA